MSDFDADGDAELERAVAAAIDSGPSLDETPPLLGSWRNIYIVVIGNLVMLILLFWLLTAAYT